MQYKNVAYALLSRFSFYFNGSFCVLFIELATQKMQL